MILKRGDTGENVKKIQERLGLDKPTGTFGPITEQKIKEWQKSNGLNDDGVVGLMTWGKMFPITFAPSPFQLEKLRITIPDHVLIQIPETASKFNITNVLRLTHFLSQCAHESGNWFYTTEVASGSAYEGRRDLGNTQPGDGRRFKGRGYIQLTGRANYKSFSDFVGEDCVANPELVATKYPMMSAAFFFNSNRLWTICDRGADDNVVLALTRRVNGGTNGLADRLKHFKIYHKILS